MASILLIEDGPGIEGQLPGLLAAAGHRVLRCGGGPTPLAACPLLRHGRCPLADAAELLVFASPSACRCAAAPTAASTCCVPTAATSTTDGFP
jgi:hypothetical protein